MTLVFLLGPVGGRNGCKVTLKTIHDCYSMAYVMRLFETCESSFHDYWTSATGIDQKGELQEAIDMLEKTDGMEVKLTDTTICEFFGTGGTPTKNDRGGAEEEDDMVVI